ncbi:MAG: sigma 54-interacting transcriptional regulator [Deltaproteobacteria bacterium]|nr:sigma 54-interacting transcriptional regulator [Deltaproteobacteria bacterium]
MPTRATTTADAREKARRRPRPQPALLLLWSPRAGVVRAPPRLLGPGRHPLGREIDPAAGIALDDPRASRLHATICVGSGEGRVQLTDEGSRNGTWVNGERIEEAWLGDGDLLRLADTFLLFRCLASDLDDAAVPGLLGRAPSIHELRRTLAAVAQHDVAVLVSGESGSGKELVARAIHELAGRRGPFVAVNCAAIPAELAESQLFGHVAGAFTGARADHPGFFRAAHGGTIFLDEVGDLPLGQQPKLLRALEERAVTPVGGTGPAAFDARVVAATNADLSAAVAAGAFRGELHARLGEFSLHVPTLRERREDVLVLLAAAYGGELPPLEAELVAALLAHPWPYNVRELRAVASELKVRAGSRSILALDLVAHRLALAGRRAPEHGSGPEEEPATAVRPGGRAAPPARAELEQMLTACRGNVQAVARATGRSRMQIYRWIEQHGLDLERYRGG